MTDIESPKSITSNSSSRSSKPRTEEQKAASALSSKKYRAKNQKKCAESRHINRLRKRFVDITEEELEHEMAIWNENYDNKKIKKQLAQQVKDVEKIICPPVRDDLTRELERRESQQLQPMSTKDMVTTVEQAEKHVYSLVEAQKNLEDLSIAILNAKNVFNKINKKKPVDLNTIKRYLDDILVIQHSQKKLDVKPQTIDFDLLKDVESTFQTVMTAAPKSNQYQPWSTGTKARRMESLFTITKFLNGFQEANEYYYTEYKKLDAEYDKTKNKNQFNEKELSVYIPWLELKGYVDPTKVSMSEFDVALTGMYTDIPPRRGDYRILRIFRKSSTCAKAEDINDNSNWLILNKKDRPVKLVLNKYKTSKTYGQQIIDLPEGLIVKLIKYLSDSNIKSHKSLVFPKEDGNEYMENSFTNIVRSTFKKYTGKDTGINPLRHSRIIHFYSQKGRPNIAQMQELARLMGNSTNEQKRYDRIMQEDGLTEEELFRKLETDDIDNDSDDDKPVIELVKPKKPQASTVGNVRRKNKK